MNFAYRLPQKEYHLAERLGEGSCGAVRTVYDDAGDVYALKVFDVDEDDECTLALETIREISTLRCMLGAWSSPGRETGNDEGSTHDQQQYQQHPNILQLLDVIEIDEDICMVMPKFTMNLTNAIEGKALGKNKLKIAHGLLSALDYCHTQGFMHRDIKGDNVMLTETMDPILIDFSLAKALGDDSNNANSNRGDRTHSGNVGTAKYIAPEVYYSKDYDVKADIWSTGVVCMEMFMDAILLCDRDKAAYARIEEIKTKMLVTPKPITGIVHAMLATDPLQRPTAHQALTMEPLRSKFGRTTSTSSIVSSHARTTARTIRVVGERRTEATTADATEGKGGKTKKKHKRRRDASKGKKGKHKASKKKGGSDVEHAIHMAWETLECLNQSTRAAAMCYAEAIQTRRQENNDDDDDDDEDETRVPAEHCVLLAMKLYESELHNLTDEVDEEDSDYDSDNPDDFITIYDYLPEFDLVSYIESEIQIFKAMEFCLFLPEDKFQQYTSS